MDPNEFFIKITPATTKTEDAESRNFNWGILNQGHLVDHNDEHVFYAFKRDRTDFDNTKIQMMRLFACTIVRDLFLKQGTVNADVYSGVDTEVMPENVKKIGADVVSILAEQILKEIIYQNDPIKPTKSKIESLSLFPKQLDNEQEGTETTE